MNNSCKCGTWFLYWCKECQVYFWKAFRTELSK